MATPPNANRGNVLDDLLLDLRFSFRLLLKAPWFASTAVLMLGVGIAATLAIFGFVDATLIRPLPYRDPARLVSVFLVDRTQPRGVASYLTLREWRKYNRTFESIEGYGGSGGWGFTLTTPDGAEHVTGLRVTSGFFRMLGINPVLGRDFRPGEDSPGAADAVLLSYGTWQRRYGGRTDILGQAVILDGTPNIIIGVLPKDLQFAPAGSAEFWPALRGNRPCEQARPCHSINAIGRLKKGVAMEEADADMKSIARALAREYPESNRDESAGIVPLHEVIFGDIAPVLLVLLSGAGLLFLIACANGASLLLVRSETRRREIAVRSAVGASYARLVRQFTAEGLVLAVLGAGCGLLLAEWAMRLVSLAIPAGKRAGLPWLAGLQMNSHLVMFGCGAALVAGLVFAVVPMTRLAWPGLLEGLKEGNRGSSGTLWRRAGANLAVVELVIAVVLLFNAGLLGKSFYRLLHVDTGFDPSHLATVELELPEKTSDTRTVAIANQIEQRIAAMPGVERAGISDQLPLASWGGTGSWFDLVGGPKRTEHQEASNRTVSPGYFSALGARLLRGRYFTAGDDGRRPPVAIINETLAKTYFAGQDPIGKQIYYTTPPHPAMTIVGVLRDIKEGPLEAQTRPAIYAPFAQSPSTSFCIAARTAMSGRPAMRAAIHEIDAAIPVHDELTMVDRMGELPSAWRHASAAWLVGVFAGLAFLLGVAGLYAVIAYSVSQRIREIGIRMALGARPGSVYRLITGEAARLAGAGAALGIPCSIGAAMLTRRLLFGVEAWDVATLILVVTALGSATLLASFLPARRAATVNTVEALRSE